ncbi:MAG: NAD(P)H-dependent oxidoreductase subunit E, partial [Bacteroidetes bacterium]
MQIERSEIDRIVTGLGSTRNMVIPILQAIQKRYNYLPGEALRRVCEITEITPGQIVGVASFYSQFRFQPAGEHMIRVCVGTACHVKGSGQVYDAFRRELELERSADTTASGKYTIEKVNCLGCCTLAPVVQIDRVTYGHVTTTQVASVLSDFEKQKRGGRKRDFRLADGSSVKGEIRI